LVFDWHSATDETCIEMPVSDDPVFSMFKYKHGIPEILFKNVYLHLKDAEPTGTFGISMYGSAPVHWFHGNCDLFNEGLMVFMGPTV